LILINISGVRGGSVVTRTQIHYWEGAERSGTTNNRVKFHGLIHQHVSSSVKNGNVKSNGEVGNRKKAGQAIAELVVNINNTSPPQKSSTLMTRYQNVKEIVGNCLIL